MLGVDEGDLRRHGDCIYLEISACPMRAYNLNTENCHFLHLTPWAEAATRGSCKFLTPNPRPYWKHCLDLCGCVTLPPCLSGFMARPGIC